LGDKTDPHFKIKEELKKYFEGKMRSMGEQYSCFELKDNI